MADSFGKKDREKKQKKKREDKAARKAQRREDEGGSDIMYLHPDGSLHPTPPSVDDQIEIDAENIVLGAQNNLTDEDPMRYGKVSFFNHDKGFGFIVDRMDNESVFVHIDSCIDEIFENSKVVFETKKGPKGMMAVNVQLEENYKPPTPVTKEEVSAEEKNNEEMEGDTSDVSSES